MVHPRAVVTIAKTTQWLNRILLLSRSQKRQKQRLLYWLPVLIRREKHRPQKQHFPRPKPKQRPPSQKPKPEPQRQWQNVRPRQSLHRANAAKPLPLQPRLLPSAPHPSVPVQWGRRASPMPCSEQPRTPTRDQRLLKIMVTLHRRLGDSEIL